MRPWWFVLALTACGHPKASGPAWPAPSTTADDGGESIAPRETKVAAAPAPVEAPEEKPAAPTAAAPAAKTGDTPAPATAPAATPPTVEDLLINEDVIIEIDD